MEKQNQRMFLLDCWASSRKQRLVVVYVCWSNNDSYSYSLDWWLLEFLPSKSSTRLRDSLQGCYNTLSQAKGSKKSVKLRFATLLVEKCSSVLFFFILSIVKLTFWAVILTTNYGLLRMLDKNKESIWLKVPSECFYVVFVLYNWTFIRVVPFYEVANEKGFLVAQKVIFGLCA